MSTKFHGVCCISILCLALFLATNSAHAVDIPITNAGFEAQPVAPGCFAVFLVDGWDVYDPNGIIDQGLDVVGGIHPEGGPFFNTPAPEGQHAAIVFLGDDIGGGAAGLRQQLDATLMPNQRYTLSVQIGDIASGQGPPPCDVFGFFNLDGFPGYQVQLWAGNQMLVEDDNTLAPLLSEGEFLESTIMVEIGADHDQLDEPLEIRLINLNQIDTIENPGIEVDFDDVRLTRECINDGDIDDNDTVDLADVALLIAVLLDNNIDAVTVARSDLDCSGQADSADIAIMVNRLLE